MADGLPLTGFRRRRDTSKTKMLFGTHGSSFPHVCNKVVNWEFALSITRC